MPSPRAALGLISLVIVCVAVLVGCGERPPPHAPPEPRPNLEGQLHAGAAKVDITPLPGMPLGGHSFEGGTGYAVWTRLWARAIYIEDEHGEPLVLVVADLWSIPAGLPDAVVEPVREHHGLTHIGRAQLLMSATHSHHSPANYSTSKLYNRAASNKMGFDPELFDFLVRRTAQAVAEAANARTPARLRLDTRALPSIARNRSLAPFVQNPEAALIVAHNRDHTQLPRCPEAPIDPGVEVDPCHAVDPTLTTVRIEDLQGRPLALAAFFAVHATSMINETDAYNGDLFAVATARAEAMLEQARPDIGDPVVALFNGPEGDVSPNWATQGRADALALGGQLGAAIAHAGLDDAAHGLAITGAIESGFSRMPLAAQPVEGPPATATSKRPLGGAAILGGAEDGRTKFHARLPEGQTVRRHRRAGQGPKKPAVPPALFTLVFPRSTIPQDVPISIHRIGELSIVGLPGEFTTVMGMRIRQVVASTGAVGAPRPIAVGLAGEYMSYFVTPEEYALQHYEGGSTLWGQYAGALVAERLGALAREVPIAEAAIDSDGAGPSARFDPGLRRRFALSPGPRANRAVRRLGPTLREQLAIAPEIDALPRLHFETLAPSWVGPTWPIVRVEVEGEAGWSPLWRDGAEIDERGTEFLTFPLEVGRERWRWAIWWLGEIPEHATLRLHATGVDGSDWCSASFTAASLPPPEGLPCTDYEPTLDPADGLGVVPSP